MVFTLFLLAIYRIGFWVPLPGVDQAQFAKIQNQQNKDTSAAGRIANYVSLFSGGTLGQSTVFGLGVMPYISASIIFQLLGTVVPQLEKLQKEGESGRKKIQEWDAVLDGAAVRAAVHHLDGVHAAERVSSSLSSATTTRRLTGSAAWCC